MYPRYKIGFSWYSGGDVKGNKSNGIPMFFVFNPKGEVAWEGHDPSGMESAAEVELKNAPDWLAGPRQYEKLKAEARKVASRQGLGTVAKDLRKKAESADEKEKSEADELLGRLQKHAERLMKRAEEMAAEGDPLGAIEIWKSLAKDFKGDEIADNAAKAEKDKGADAAFKKELEAAKIFDQIEKAVEKMDLPGHGEDVDKWKKKNAAAVNGLVAAFKKIESKYPDTKVCARAREFMKILGVS